MPKTYDDIHYTAIRANALMKGLLIVLQEEELSGIESSQVIAESVAELTAELVSDLDSANRPKAAA